MDIVSVSALENLVSKHNSSYPKSNEDYYFKKQLSKISQTIIDFDEEYLPKKLNNKKITNIIDLFNKIYISSVNENYSELKHLLKEYLEKTIFYLKDNDSNNPEFDNDDIRMNAIYEISRDYTYDTLKNILKDLESLDFNIKDSITEQIDESYFIDLAYNDSNDEIIRISIEAISDNNILLNFAENGKTIDIRKTAIKKLTNNNFLVDLAINQTDNDIKEAQFFNEKWICDYVRGNLDYFSVMGFNTYDFFNYDLEFYERSFDNRLNSFYFNTIADFYYWGTLGCCIFRKIKNSFDLIYILKNTPSFVLRDLIIYKITNPIILADIALNAKNENIRSIAFGRINSKSILKYVFSKTKDFRIKYAYLSKIDDYQILEESFLNEDNDVLRMAILGNKQFMPSKNVIEFCVNNDSYISTNAKKLFPKKFINYFKLYPK